MGRTSLISFKLAPWSTSSLTDSRLPVLQATIMAVDPFYKFIFMYTKSKEQLAVKLGPKKYAKMIGKQ